MSSNVEFKVTALRTNRQAHGAGIYAHVQIALVIDGTPYVDLRDASLRVAKDGQSYWIASPSRQYQARDGQKKYSQQWYLFPKADRPTQDSWQQFLVAEVLKVLPNPEVSSEDAGAYSNQPSATQSLPQAPQAPRNAAPASQAGYAPQQSGPPMPSMPSVGAPTGRPPQAAPAQARPATAQPFRPPAMPPRTNNVPVGASVGAPPILGSDDGFPA